MTNETLLAISGTIILGLLCILGWFLAGVMKKMDNVALDVAKILAINGITNEKLKTHEEQISFLQAKQHDNAEKWTELWKDYNLNQIKHK
jgi:hypothetical protein